jgi:hypothetical protein
MFASRARGRTLVALFPSQSACVATLTGKGGVSMGSLIIQYERGREARGSSARHGGKPTGTRMKSNQPVRERRCICIFPFDAFALALEGGFDFD